MKAAPCVTWPKKLKPHHDVWNEKTGLTSVTPPDDDGYVQFGAHHWSKRGYVRRARHTIAEVDAGLRPVFGDNKVHVTEIDAFEVEATGELPLLVVAHIDRPGEIAAVSHALAEGGVNIASMQVSREKRGAGALMLISTDAEVDPATVELIGALPGVTSVRQVAAV